MFIPYYHFLILSLCFSYSFPLSLSLSVILSPLFLLLLSLFQNFVLYFYPSLSYSHQTSERSILDTMKKLKI